MYPKLLILRDDQSHKEKWSNYFRAMYLDECKRLGLSTDEEKMKSRSGQRMLNLENGTNNDKTT